MSKTGIIIPVKRESRRLKDKNFLKVGNDYLLTRAIKRAVDSKLGDVIISTDDPVVVSNIVIEQQLKCSFSMHRLKDSFYKHGVRMWKTVLETAKDYNLDTIIITLVTSPFCTSDHLVRAYQLFINKGRKPVMSIKKANVDPCTLCSLSTKNKKMETYMDFNKIGMYKNSYVSNGAVYICDTKDLEKNQDQYCDNLVGYIMDEISSVDINTKLDLEFANFLIEKGYAK